MQRWPAHREKLRYYPWALMQVEDHFFAPYRSGRTEHQEQCYMVRQCCRAAKQFNMKFRTKQTSLGIKITRIS